ncbi:MAG: KEOPS complex subunit Pcc1 [Candidatus Thorarchaeota archaeon]
MIAHIQLEFDSEEVARRTLSAISPDNYPLPSGLEIKCSVHNQLLTIIVQSDRGVDSLGATLEDLMSAIDLSMRTSKSVDAQEN